MNDEFVEKCVVDTLKRRVVLYSSQGDKKTVDCDTVDEFMRVLSFVRNTVDEDMLVYSDPI
tara:strand:+ start:44 stop:226 length:183 start_codon:yes stop_codon:yes gene_type:complete